MQVRITKTLMGEEQDHTADQDVDTTDNGADDQEADATADDADTAQKTDAKDDSDNTGSDDGDDKGKGDSGKKSSDTADEEADGDEDDGAEPELRMPKKGDSNTKWAAWRAQEKAKASKDTKKSDDDSKGDDDVDEDDDGLSPEDAAAFDKRIAKHMAPFKQQAAEQEVDGSIATFVKDNPDFAPFAAKAKRFAMHPSRESVPIKAIFYEVAGDKLMRIGAQRAKAADIKAKKTQTGGGTATTEKGEKSYHDMSQDDFAKELEAVKSGTRR
jgi:hypothetical protein